MSSNKWLVWIAVLIMVIAIVIAFSAPKSDNDEIRYVYVTVTPEPVITYTPTVEPTPTIRPIYVIRVTNDPTVEPTAVVTEAPTVEPTAVVTEAPTAEPTVVVTDAPTISPTAVVTEAPTAEPTPVITVAPTKAPSFVIVEKPDSSKLEAELKTLVMMGGIYPEYTLVATYDLYDYIDVEGMEEDVLFNALRKPFEDAIANWTDMEFDFFELSVNRLSKALESSICKECERVKIINHPENADMISKTFDEISKKGEMDKANKLILDFLFANTIKNPDNPNERLFISCDCN